VREAVREALSEFTEGDDDPDVGLEFKPEIAERLRAFGRERPQGQPLDDVVRELGLDEF
jgi:hypothetical protein